MDHPPAPALLGKDGIGVVISHSKRLSAGSVNPEQVL
jgi:hypothetical protein